MKKFKLVKIPYSKENEEKEREKFWKYSHRAFKYPSVASSFSSLKKVNQEGKESSFDLSDDGRGEREIYSRIEFELLTLNLPRKEKEAIQLKSEGLPREKVAEKMGIKENAVKQLIFRGYKRIKERTVITN